MIITLTGKITDKDINFVIMETGGIGYQIFTNQTGGVVLDEKAKFFIYEHIREDRHDLYGFLSFEDMSFFNKLLAVDGVGPKMAQNISALGFARVQKAVMAGDVAAIQTVHGVGRKTAQKIILELKGAMDKILSGANINQEAAEALTSIGYSRGQAEQALSEIGEAVSGTEAQIKAALKLLGKK
jgi:Holliday junction DNA helicase RuvA